MAGDIPANMNFIDLPEFGGPEVLVPAEGPVPRPGPGEVLVQVRAAGVNRPDVLQRKGGYNPPPGASPVPGLEIAGEIVADYWKAIPVPGPEAAISALDERRIESVATPHGRLGTAICFVPATVSRAPEP